MNELKLLDDEQEKPVPHGFVVDSLDKAEWALAKKGSAQAEIDRYREMASALKAPLLAKLKQIDDRLAEIEKPHRATMERMNELVRPWADVEIAKANGRRSVKLLSGTVGYRQAPASLVVTDEDRAVVWLRDHNAEECVMVKRSVRKSEAKKLIEENGEVPDGCELRQGDIRFYAEPCPPLLEK